MLQKHVMSYFDELESLKEMSIDANKAFMDILVLAVIADGEVTDEELAQLDEELLRLPFIWDKDVVGCIVRGVETDGTGIYNVAGDGVMTLKEVAGRLGKRFIGLPANIVGGALSVLSKYELSQYGPEQVRFLQYRPVLGNDRLKRDFGYRPELTSRQVFDLYADR